MGFEFTGLDPTYKVPRFIGRIVFSAGAISASSLPMFCLYIGPKTSAGSITADTDVVEVFSEDDVDARAGGRSLLAFMARNGIKAAPTSRHFIAAVADPSGSPTAATATFVIGGAWDTPGEVAFEVGGYRLAVSIGADDAIDTVGAAIDAKFDSHARVPVTAVYTAGSDTLTLTAANTGAVGRDWIVRVDKSRLPAGMTITATGGSLDQAGNAAPSLGAEFVRLGASSTGTGSHDITNILTKLQTTRYARIALAFNDGDNGALIESHVNAKAAEDKMLFEQVVVAVNGTQTAATTLATATFNAQRVQVLWMRNAMIHPGVIAAAKAAIRASTEGADPVPDYDGLVLPNIPPHGYDGDNMLDSEQNAALNNGVTPIITRDGRAQVVRSITSYCLLGGVGGTQDERTLDIGDAVMPDYGILDLKLLYETEFRPNNKYVGPDPAPTEPEPPAGVAYPRMWNSRQFARMQDWYDRGWIESPAANPPVSQYNATVRAIEALTPLVVRRVQHSLRQIVRQQAP